MKEVVSWASSHRVALAVAVLVMGCRPDLSTPDKAASAFVQAVNSGDYKKFEQVVGLDAVANAVQDCEKWNAKPLPVVTGIGWEREMRQNLRDYAELRKAQKCSEIASDLKGFLSYMSRTPGMKVRAVEESTKDGVERATAELLPPGWSGNEEQIDKIILVKSGSGAWVPSMAEWEATPIANYSFALHGASRGYAETQLSRLLNKQ